LDEPLLAEIGAKYDRSPAGVVLAWNATRGVVPIPSSMTTDHIVDNAAAVATRLDNTDRERIAGLENADFER